MSEVIIMRRNGDRLVPVTERDREILLEIPENADLTVKTSRTRSPRQHRLYFALLHLVVDNHPYYDRPDQLLEWLKVRLGYVEETTWHDGQVWFKTKSISFYAMGQDEFRKFFSLSVRVITEEVLIGMGIDDLLREVSAMIGTDARTSYEANVLDDSRNKQSS